MGILPGKIFSLGYCSRYRKICSRISFKLWMLSMTICCKFSCWPGRFWICYQWTTKCISLWQGRILSVATDIVLIQCDCCPYEKREIWRLTHREDRKTQDTGRSLCAYRSWMIHLQTKKHRGLPTKPETRRGIGKDSQPKKEPTLPTSFS